VLVIGPIITKLQGNGFERLPNQKKNSIFKKQFFKGISRRWKSMTWTMIYYNLSITSENWIMFRLTLTLYIYIYTHLKEY